MHSRWSREVFGSPATGRSLIAGELVLSRRLNIIILMFLGPEGCRLVVYT